MEINFSIVRKVLFCVVYLLMVRQSTLFAFAYSYTIGAIPDITSRGTSPVSFQIEPSVLLQRQAIFSVSASPKPAGLYSISDSGLFLYTPDPSDKQDIVLTFSIVPKSGVPGIPEKQKVTVARFIKLSSEIGLVNPAQTGQPDEEGTEFMLVSTSLVTLPTRFNSSSGRSLRDITTSGKKIVFQRQHENGLYETLNYASGQNDDVHSLTVYAETLEVRSSLRLPGTKVTIYASALIFVDDDPEGPSVIDTTPLPFSKEADDLQAGLRGQDAADIEIHVNTLSYPSHPVTIPGFGHQSTVELPRIILSGGQGQQGGQGRRGSDASPMHDYAPFWTIPSGLLDVFVNPGTVCIMATDGSVLAGTKSWPDGGNAVPGGAPGNGGSGGHLYVFADGSALEALKLQVQKAFRATTGDQGERPPQASGGNPSTPSHARWRHIGGNDDEHDSVAGKAADAPDPDPSTIGQKGDVIFQQEEPLTWLTPAALEMVVAYARAAYLNNQYTAASHVLTDYKSNLENLPASRSSQFTHLQNEITLLLSRLYGNLDYFGNPPGWVPMLSFQVNMQAFKNEVDSSIQILFLTELLKTDANGLKAKISDLNATISSLKTDINTQTSKYNSLQGEIPSLQSQLETINRAQQEFAQELKDKQDSLTRQATLNVALRDQKPAWQQAISVLSTAAKVIPIGQPVIAMAGTALSGLSQLTSDPAGAVGQIAGITDAFADSNIATAEKQLNDTVSGIAGNNNETFKQQATNIIKAGQGWANAYKQVTDAATSASVPAQEVQEELQEIEAQDQQFTDLVAKVNDLAGQKAKFSEDIASSIQEAGEVSTQITDSIMALDSANQAVNSASAVLDHNMLLRVDKISRQVQERLIKYHYYLAKASEYELLEPYNADLNVYAFLGKVQDLVKKADSSWLNDPNNFKALAQPYYDDLDKLGSTVFGNMSNRPPREQSKSTFSLTVAELSQLNSAGWVRINLGQKGLIGATEENARLTSIAAVQIKARTAKPVTTGELDLIFEHSGVSIMHSGAHSFGFHHYRNDNDPPISWGSNLDLVAGGVIPTQEQVASSEVAMLGYLLRNNPPADPTTLYSHAAADADIIIEKQLKPTDITVTIDDVKIEADYEFLRASKNQKVLMISSNVGLPLIGIDKEDLSGKSDGRGRFRRVYHQDTNVNLSAQDRYGRFFFKGWRRGESTVPDNPLKLTMTDVQEVEAIYEP